MKKEEEIKIERLYRLRDQMRDAGKKEEEATLKWAIFNLERLFNVNI